MVKPKNRINLAAVLLFFGFAINSKCLMQQL